jgi:deazaflavin-dependent oxidoreductase (nitroreductase family)
MPYRDRVRYRPPSPRVARLNRVIGRLAAVGLMPRDTVELEVTGRRTGRPRRVALVLTEYEGDHYLVSLAGEAEWVRNARAAGLRVTLRRWRAQRVRLHEVPADERAPILKAYLSKRATSKSPEYEAREFFGVPVDATLDDLAAIAPHYPVFRIGPERSPLPASR